MAILQGNAKSVADGGFYPLEINQSLRFDDGSSSYLSRTPSVSGNRKTWTWSGWVKRGNLSAQQLLCCYNPTGGAGYHPLGFDSNGAIQFEYVTTVPVGRKITNALLRDPSAWYHIVAVWDTTNATAADRIRLYVNGERITSFSASVDPAQNTDGFINGITDTRIGSNPSNAQLLDGYLAEVHFTDGTAYTADDFGEFKSGVWVAKTPSVTYGTNGFYLPFNLSGDLGADSAYTIHDIFGDSSATATYLLDGDATDEGGNYNGTASGVTYGDGISGTQAAIYTDGDYITLPIPNTSTFSVAMWARSDVLDNAWHELFDCTNHSPSRFTVGFVNKQLVVYDTAYRYSSYYISDYSWHHYVITQNGSALQMYADGELVYNSTCNGSQRGNFKLGRYGLSSPNENWIGAIDQVRVFNRVITQDEVTELAGGYGLDSSGIGNNWIANNLAISDVMLDSPTNNFATLNPLATQNKQAALAEGSLYATLTAPSTDNCYSNVKLPTSGKWYWETYHLRTGHGLAIGITKDEYAGNLSVPSTAYTYYNADGTKWNNNSGSAYGSSFFATSTWYTVGVYYDADAGTVGFTLDGVDQGTAFSSLDTSEGYYACASNESGSGSISVYWNFGQDSSFAGTKTPQGYTDANGIGDFYYAPPTGYLALCTANLPEPAISPLNDVSPQDHMNTVLYTGDGVTKGSGGQAISGVGFQPDFVWIKNRAVDHHVLHDSVRGIDGNGDYYVMHSSATNAESSQNATWHNSFGGMTSIGADGFTVYYGTGSTNDNYNKSGNNYVAWNWKANGTPVTNTNGTITSSVSANTESGFSIVSYTGTGANATVGHGLNQAPEMVIVKDRDRVVSWVVGVESLTFGGGLSLDLTDAYAANSAWFNSTSPTSSVISVGTGLATNYSGHNMIAYCFHSVEGFSKCGSYVGNGSSDGTFVYCGFRPSMIICKRTDSADNWRMYDTTRSTYNASTKVLFPNLSNAEDASTDHFDWLSNGFKCKSTNINASGGTYIFIAFAEMPVKYSLGR